MSLKSFLRHIKTPITVPMEAAYIFSNSSFIKNPDSNSSHKIIMPYIPLYAPPDNTRCLIAF